MAGNSLEKAFLIAAEDDWISFAEITFVVLEERPAFNRTEVMECAIATAEAIAKRGLWRAGDLTLSGFLRWDVTPEEASKRMREALAFIDRPLLPGDVCWFEIYAKSPAVV
jgi:hypothetical protein